ncbi:MAG: nicotinate-nucleotide adenylyltransferase [Gammaproteobacteria bacterium]
MKTIALLGGTFDPIHLGHLGFAHAVLDQKIADEIRFMIAYKPIHREQPKAAPNDRFQMLSLAIENIPGFEIEPYEFQQQKPMATVQTLQHLRTLYSDASLCLMIGMDQFAAFHEWHEWQRIPTLAHLIVAERPEAQWPDSGPMASEITKRLTQNPEDLRNQPAGCILGLNMPMIDISATAIRMMLQTGKTPKNALPAEVADYIVQQNLYNERNQ